MLRSRLSAPSCSGWFDAPSDFSSETSNPGRAGSAGPDFYFHDETIDRRDETIFHVSRQNRETVTAY
jgi:hypothetical protein